MTDDAIIEEEPDAIADQSEGDDGEEGEPEENKTEDKEANNEKGNPIIIIAQFFIPFIIALVVIGCLFLIFPSNKAYTLLFWMGIYFFLIGKEGFMVIPPTC